jgi:hypothetical protein
VSSGGRSIFPEAGEGNSSGVTAISLDDEAENAHSWKREILAVRQQDFCKGTVGSEVGSLSEPVGSSETALT